MIKAILACDQEWGIGKGWQPCPGHTIQQILKWFKENTTGWCMIVMGKSTWDSLARSSLCPNVENIIVTRSETKVMSITDYQFVKFAAAKARANS